MLNYSKIKKMSSEKNISQTKMAELIGMTREGYGRMLRDKSMKVSTLENIAKALKVPVTYFFEEENGSHKSNNEVNEQRAEYKTRTEYKEEINHLRDHIKKQNDQINFLQKLVGSRRSESSIK